MDNPFFIIGLIGLFSGIAVASSICSFVLWRAEKKLRERAR